MRRSTATYSLPKEQKISDTKQPIGRNIIYLNLSLDESA